MFLLNYFTSKWWDIDIGVVGVMIAIFGLVIAIASNKIKNSKKWLTRKNGLCLCVIGGGIVLITGLANLFGLTNSGGGFGAIIFWG